MPPTDKSDSAQASLALLERRATAGNGPARFALAKHYRDGTAGPPDFTKSMELLLQAAGSGHYRSMWLVSFYYRTGRGGFPRDDNRAWRWEKRITEKLHRDAKAGHAYARNELAAIQNFRAWKRER